uniref:Uncharacterized protein n=1 Tax=Anguilla anguilla TaxID=7936 RepID=A0A0E9SV85_ANGAN
MEIFRCSDMETCESVYKSWPVNCDT